MRTRVGFLFAVTATLYASWNYFHAPGGLAALDWLALAIVLPCVAALAYLAGWLFGLTIEKLKPGKKDRSDC